MVRQLNGSDGQLFSIFDPLQVFLDRIVGESGLPLHLRL